MPRYFFNHAGDGYPPDDEGLDLPDLGAARIEATCFAAERLRDRPQYAWDDMDFRIEVTDGDGLLLFTILVLGIDAPAVRVG